ncbi:MAG: mercury(II) reductase [Candidatus Altiarchaeota archaeon]|nr:mercury(II) reductase [Candidatus Altiarchaeota archaeon]
MENKKYDLIIVGGGAAAFAASNRANALGKKTLMINNGEFLPLGGTCVNVGCIPSKIMIHQGRSYYYALKNKFRAIKMNGKIDLVDALRETRSMVEEFRAKNYLNVIKKQKHVEFKGGFASLQDKNNVRVGDEVFFGKNILIATGASTYIPPIKGVEAINYFTNENIFKLDKIPKSMIIIGAGPSGMEFASMFHHFGVEVTVFQRSSQILSKFDTQIANELEKHLKAEGITIYTGSKLKSFEKTKDKTIVNADVRGSPLSVTADILLFTTGLAPRTKGLGAEKAGVGLDKKGFVKTNEYFQTSQNNIYAVGDVIGKMPLETVAAKQGNLATQNMFEDARKTINYYEVPQAVFTSPEVASVGITEKEYKEKYGNCLCSTISFEHVEKALAIKDARGIINMVIDPKTKQVLGVHITGPMAADIITTATYAVKNKMTINSIRDTVHVFPTLSEAIKKVAQSFDQNLEEMACCVE